MEIVVSWNGESADALRHALRMTVEAFADHLGVSRRTVAYWHSRPDMVPSPAVQQALDEALAKCPERAKAQFALTVSRASANGASPNSFSIPYETMTGHKWTRDDARILSASLDSAISAAAAEEIERLSHIWLISEAPQTIELAVDGMSVNR